MFRRLFSPTASSVANIFSTYFWSTAHAKICAQRSTEQCVFGVVFHQHRTWILWPSCHNVDNEIRISSHLREQDQNGITSFPCPVLLLFSSHTACSYPVRLPTNTTKRPPKLKHITMLKKLPTNLNKKQKLTNKNKETPPPHIHRATSDPKCLRTTSQLLLNQEGFWHHL